jgi:CRP-like cAMP-binding protein
MYQIDFFKNQDNAVEYKAGDIIFAEGAESDATMYAVREGTVEIVLKGAVIDTIEEGQFFGEMSLVDTAPRSATARAKTDAKIIPVDRSRFLFLVHETPTFALQVMHVMAERLRRLMN